MNNKSKMKKKKKKKEDRREFLTNDKHSVTIQHNS
jgi:hypothetical protein